MAQQTEIRTNTDTVVVNVQSALPYDPSDFSVAKFKYVGVNPTGAQRGEKSVTETLGYSFVEGEVTEVTDPKAKYKLRGNVHFEEVGGKKSDNRSADSPVDPTEQGAGWDETQRDARRGQNYETMRDTPSVLDLPNPLSAEQQKLTDQKDIEAGRAPTGEASDRTKPSAAAKKSAKAD